MPLYFAVNVTTGALLTRKARSYSEIKLYAQQKAITTGKTIAIRTQEQLDAPPTPVKMSVDVHTPAFKSAYRTAKADLAARRVASTDIKTACDVVVHAFVGVRYVPRPVYKVRQDYPLSQSDVAYLIAAALTF